MRSNFGSLKDVACQRGISLRRVTLSITSRELPADSDVGKCQLDCAPPGSDDGARRTVSLDESKAHWLVRSSALYLLG